VFGIVAGQQASLSLFTTWKQCCKATLLAASRTGNLGLRRYTAAVIPASLLAAASTRRRRLSALLTAPALIPAGRARPRNYAANTFPFRASSHFLYLVGRPVEGAALWLDGEQALLLLDPEADDHALWHGAQPSRAQLADELGLGLATWDQLAALQGERIVATVPPPDLADAHQLGRALGRDVRELGRAGVDEPLLDALVALRLSHDEAALRELRRAADVSVQAHVAGMGATRPGVSESAVCAAMEFEFTRLGFVPAYGSIVTVHGEVLHNHDHGHTLRAGDLLLADVGAESETGYAADVTRTWPASGRFSPTQRTIYELVLAMQERAIAAVRPGARYRDVHLVAARTLVDGLVQLGILQGDVDSLVDDGAHALFFPHGIGHLLGLDVHDMEDLGDRAGYAAGRTRSTQFGLGYLRLDRDLAPGMLVTIEPGFYQVRSLLADPERVGLSSKALDRTELARFADVRGIRIEDDVLVTEQGHEVLTQALPKRPMDIEQLLASGSR
jgi:Xaa-Pro aminopeptidase